MLLSSWVLKGLKLIKPGGDSAVTEMISPPAAGRRRDTTSLTSILTNAQLWQLAITAQTQNTSDLTSCNSSLLKISLWWNFMNRSRATRLSSHLCPSTQNEHFLLKSTSWVQDGVVSHFHIMSSESILSDPELSKMFRCEHSLSSKSTSHLCGLLCDAHTYTVLCKGFRQVRETAVNKECFQKSKS